MNDNTLKRLWLSSCRSQHVELNAERFIYSTRRNISRMEKQIKWRDRREISACIFMSILFSWLLCVVPTVLGKTGMGILVASCLFTIFKIIDARKNKMQEDDTSEIKQHLVIALSQVRQQINLLTKVLWWNLLPFYIGIICFLFSLPMSFAMKAILSCSIALLYMCIYNLNLNAVKKQLRPLEKDIIKVLNELSV
jgi:hypothetical protein